MKGMGEAGYIRYQLGSILLAQTEAIKLGAIDRYVDLCHQAVTLCFPKLAKSLDECEAKAEDLLSLIREPAEDYAGARREKDALALQPALFDACQRMMRRLLHLMTDAKLYAYNETPTKDGSGIALDEDDTSAAGMTV